MNTQLFTTWKAFIKQYHSLLRRYAFKYLRCIQQASLVAYKALRHCWVCRKQIASSTELRQWLRTNTWLLCITSLHYQEQLIRSTTITTKTYQQ